MVKVMTSDSFRLHRTPYKTASHKNIKQFDYFINEEDRKKFLDYSESSEFFNSNTDRLNNALAEYEKSDKSIPFNRSLFSNILRISHQTTPEIYDLAIDYQNRATEVIQYSFGFPVLPLYGSCDFRKWHPTEYQEPHSDSEGKHDGTHDYYVNPFEVDNYSSLFIEVGCVMYLNDEYEGGEIYFPAYDIEIKPKAGDLIFFPGSNLYMHGVREIKSGIRYTFTTFYTTPKLEYIRKMLEGELKIENQK